MVATEGGHGTAGQVVAEASPGTGLRERFRTPTAKAGLGLTGLFCIVAIAADLIAPSDPFAFVGQAFKSPSTDHWLGTDDLGRDVLSGVVHGARTSLIVGLVVAVSSLIIGTVIGAAAGFAGGWVDDVLMRLTELVQVMPRFFLALMVVALFGPGLPNLIVVLALTSWELIARVVRSAVLSVKEADFVVAARAVGAPAPRLLWTHILPNAIAPAVALAALQVGGAILIEAGLSFLGLGDPNRVSWGYMLNNAQPFVRRAWWLSVFPGAAVAMTLLGINLLSDALSDRVPARPPRRIRRRFRGHVDGPGPSPLAEGPDPGLDPGPNAGSPLLAVEELRVQFGTDVGPLIAVDGLTLTIGRGEVLGLVGESGCGKTVTALAIAGLLDETTAVVDGRVWFDGIDLTAQPESAMNRIRGSRIAMIFQEPGSSLDPVKTVGHQIGEVLRRRDDIARGRRRQTTIDLLDRVGIPDPRRVVEAYAHQLSGGMAQRVMIAIALAGGPDLLIADEPTTALDVTVQAQILELLQELSETEDMAILLITHDLDVVSEFADRVAVMYAGVIVEELTVDRLGHDPRHPYTTALLAARPGVARSDERLATIPGTVPTMVEQPAECRFAARCGPRVEWELSICCEAEPALAETGTDHSVRCWLHQDSLDASDT